MRTSPILLAGFIVLSSLALRAQNSPPSNAATLQEDPNGHQKPYFWAPGASVDVYIDSTSFPTGSSAAYAVMAGFTNNKLAYGNQGVSYNFISSTGVPSGTGPTAWVTTAGFDLGPGYYGLNTTQATYDPSLGYNSINYATIQLSADIVGNDTSLTYASSHEDSHDYGLGDCPDCTGGSTIMSYQIDINNPPIDGPTGEDVNYFAAYGGGGGSEQTGPCDGHDCTLLPP